MSWIRRFANLIRASRIDREIDEELASHLDEAIERGRSPQEARRALGSPLRHRESSRDVRLIPWLDALASDVVFGWRQLNKHRAVSAAAILSLALAIGTTTAAFRLVDAVLLRPLPVAEPQRLFYVAVNQTDPRNGKMDYRDDFDYPTYRKYAQRLDGIADTMVVGMNALRDVSFRADGEPERIYRQFVSGNFFGTLGLRPAAGRLLIPDDDVRPGAHALAVLSYDFWTRRFGRDPKAIGATFRLDGRSYEIVGVGPKGFTGTEPGVITDVFIPATMNVGALESRGWSWFRLWVRPRPAISEPQVVQPLQAELVKEIENRVQQWDATTLRTVGATYRNQSVMLLPATAGASEMQRTYRRPLIILGVLVVLILLMACVNVGNLLNAQAAARAREMALRTSIGAGKGRLVQLMLVESALLAMLASLAGALVSWWSAPWIVSMLAPSERPVRLVLDADWRGLGFGAALTAAVALFFGLAPALRASSVQPINALKGSGDLQARRGFLRSTVALQVAFCVLVLFVSGLFVSTFQRLSRRPLGFSADGVVVLETVSRDRLPLEVWNQLADRLAQRTGAVSTALAGWMPLSGNHWTSAVRASGHDLETLSPYFLDVSQGYFSAMKIGWIDGRDFRPGDVAVKLTGNNQPVAGVGIVNEAFARAYFDGQNPVGRVVDVHEGKDAFVPMTIVGYVRDSCYSSVRETIRPTVFVPIESRSGGQLILRMPGDPRALGPVLRREISQARSDIMVRSVESQSARVAGQMIRERLLASISLFFAIVALVLAGVGLYGVLNYSVTLERREIGIRMTLGARPGQVVKRITGGMFALVCLGAGAGLAGGLACQRFVETLLYEVKGSDPIALTIPLLMLLGTALLAALPPAIRAVKTDPMQTLRSE